MRFDRACAAIAWEYKIDGCVLPNVFVQDTKRQEGEKIKGRAAARECKARRKWSGTNADLFVLLRLTVETDKL